MILRLHRRDKDPAEDAFVREQHGKFQKRKSRLPGKGDQARGAGQNLCLRKVKNILLLLKLPIIKKNLEYTYLQKKIL